MNPYARIIDANTVGKEISVIEQKYLRYALIRDDKGIVMLY